MPNDAENAIFATPVPEHPNRPAGDDLPSSSDVDDIRRLIFEMHSASERHFIIRSMPACNSDA